MLAAERMGLEKLHKRLVTGCRSLGGQHFVNEGPLQPILGEFQVVSPGRERKMCCFED